MSHRTPGILCASHYPSRDYTHSKGRRSQPDTNQRRETVQSWCFIPQSGHSTGIMGNVAGYPYDSALRDGPEGADILDRKRSTEIYEGSVHGKGTGDVSQRDLPGVPHSDSEFPRSSNKSNTVGEQWKEDPAHRSIPSSGTPASSINQHTGVNSGDQFANLATGDHKPTDSSSTQTLAAQQISNDPTGLPRKRAEKQEECLDINTANTPDLGHASQHNLSTNPNQGDFAHSGTSSHQLVDKQSNEELPNPHGVYIIPYSPPSRRSGQPPSGSHLDGQYPAEDAKPLPRTPNNGQSGHTDSELSHPSPRFPPVRENRKEAVGGNTPNIVIFGETGVGKSSIVNLISDQKLARTSNSAVGCTFHHERHLAVWGNTSCALWDTAGLDEGSQGTVPAKEAEDKLKELMQELARSGGIHLVVYCIRGSRLTKALKHNYDLFYVTVCRKKVPVALVVTGLEYHPGEMEKWWDTNQAVLRRLGMRFDAHACVTTLRIEDLAIQRRRSESQRRLRELVTDYSRRSGWKSDSSFISRILPSFRSVFNGTSSTGNPGNTTIIRKVIVCGSFTEFFPGTSTLLEKSTGQIGSEQFQIIRVDKRALSKDRILEDAGGMDAGVLVFYSSSLERNTIPSNDVVALKTFYDVAGGRLYPVVVVLRGCNNQEDAQACSAQIASYYSYIQARFVPLPVTDDAQARLEDMIERLCIEQVELKPKFFKRYLPMVGQRQREDSYLGDTTSFKF